VEVEGLHGAQRAAQDLKVQVEALEKTITGSKATEELALDHLQKAADANESL